MYPLHLFLILCLLVAACSSPEADTAPPDDGIEPPIETDSSFDVIAFGSCNKHNVEQPLWDDIMAVSPDLWVWLGDNVYGDTENMSFLRTKYDAQYNQPDYKQLRESIPVIGIWDDHDYGVNDGWKNYPKKDESKAVMFDFLDVPADHPSWAHEGAYQSYTFGDEGKLVKMILLDARYFRDPLERVNGVYQPNPDGTVLGEEQWEWLADELSDDDVDLYVIASGIQFLSAQHRFEKWANFPNERQRLFDLLQQKQPNAAILLSGDRHIGEISVLEVEGLDYPIVDVTSSGLTHAFTGNTTEVNDLREGPIVNKLNFGVLNLEWTDDNLTVLAEIRGDSGVVHTSKRISY